MTIRRPIHFLLAVICLGGWLGAGGPSRAQEKAKKRPTTSTETPIEVIANFKLRADPVEPADFVKKSRPSDDSLQYIPLGAAKPEPATRIMTFDEIKAKEAELDGVRARHDRIGARAAPKGPVKSVAYAPKVLPVKKPKPCLITCVVEPRPVRN